jgi:hypothetical protein
MAGSKATTTAVADRSKPQGCNDVQPGGQRKAALEGLRCAIEAAERMA